MIPAVDYQNDTLPNGWPQPTFISTGEDGSLNIEWCFGKQGAYDSWRVMFAWDPVEGGMACMTTRYCQEMYSSEDGTAHLITPSLGRWLQPKPKYVKGARPVMGAIYEFGRFLKRIAREL